MADQLHCLINTPDEYFQEFIVQHDENANPPTFFLTLETLIQQMGREDKMVGGQLS